LSFVLDVSATIALLYGEALPAELKQLEKAIRHADALVPQLWHLEVANVLLMGLRKNRHDLNGIRGYLSDLSRPLITVDGETQRRAWDSVLELAAKHRLTSYDAVYLELAVRMRAPLATLDRDLIRAAKAEGVALFWS